LASVDLLCVSINFTSDRIYGASQSVSILLAFDILPLRLEVRRSRSEGLLTPVLYFTKKLEKKLRDEGL
jgi:hypothetical protein